jgi:hypothetical protein
MTRVIRLYPRAWRDRYEAEVVDLLASRPPSVADRLDLARGALDAWRNPHLVAIPEPPVGTNRPWGPGTTLAALGGGLLAIAGGIGMQAASVIPWLGYKDSGTPVTLLVIGLVLTAVAAVRVAWSPGSRRAGRLAGLAMLVAALGMIAPWPILIIAFFAYIASAIAFALVRWLGDGEPLIGLVAPATIALLALNTEDERALLAIPFGLAWIVVGAGLARRRALAAA